MVLQGITQIRVNGREITQMDFEGETVWEKPSAEYTEVKCLIAHGTERISTGIIPNNNYYGFETKFNVDGSSETGDPSDGIWDWNIINMGGTNVDEYRFGFGGWLGYGGMMDQGNTQPAGIRANGYGGGPGVTYGQDYTVLFNYNHSLSCYMNGEEVSGGALVDGDYEYSDPWNVFCQVYNDGSTQYARFFYGKLYYLKIWLGTTLVRDYIPVLDANNVPCLYDRINGTYNYNAGTGTLGYEPL